MARVYVFNCYTMEVLARPSKIPQEGVASVSFSADGKLLATVGMDTRSTLSVFEWESQTLVAHDYVFKARQHALKHANNVLEVALDLARSST